MTTLSDGPSEFIYSFDSETELTAEVGAATEQLARVDTQLRQQGAVLGAFVKCKSRAPRDRGEAWPLTALGSDEPTVPDPEGWPVAGDIEAGAPEV
jgi:hypothetical protein